MWARQGSITNHLCIVTARMSQNNDLVRNKDRACSPRLPPCHLVTFCGAGSPYSARRRAKTAFNGNEAAPS